MAATRIDLIRHGEPVGGIRFRGQTDDPLSPKGWTQMQDAVGDYREWDAIVSSPLLRCREFGEKTAHRLNVPFKIEDDFREIAFGDWEGLSADEVGKIDPHAVNNFYRDPSRFPPAGGESLSGFNARVVRAWEQLLRINSGRRILLVAHGGTIRIVMSHVLQIPLSNLFRLTVANASITRIQHFSDDAGDFAQLIFHHGSL